MIFDNTVKAWLGNCPVAEEATPIYLSDFRVLKRLPGPSNPPVYHVNCHCNICERSHSHLTTEFALDVAPVTTPPPVAYNLLTGKMDLAVELAYSLEQELMKGEWPLSGYCYNCEVTNPLWPSLLREVRPHGPSSLVSYYCITCEAIQVDELANNRLNYPSS